MPEPFNLPLAACAAALFTSDLSAASAHEANEVSEAIRRALHRYGGADGCAEELAAAYGDHPDTASRRMRWALAAVRPLNLADAFGQACDDRGPISCPR
jgi:hypothetical protein